MSSAFLARAARYPAEFQAEAHDFLATLAWLRETEAA